MALVISSNATTATGMSPIVEGALYADPIFIDGVTFTSRHNIGNAGQIQVVKYERGASVVDPGQPGADFSDEEYKNKVLDINCNNAYRKSVKVPAYFGATLPMDVMADKAVDVTLAVAEGRQASGIANLVQNGTTAEDTTAITVDNVKSVILSGRKTLRKKHAKPNVIFCSVDTYTTIVEASGKELTPVFNDDVARMGRVGRWLGFTIFEVPLLDNVSTYKYLDASGSSVSVDVSKVDFIMYDFMALSIIDRLDTLRYILSENFNGGKVQEELSVGFLVTNKDCVLVKKKQ